MGLDVLKTVYGHLRIVRPADCLNLTFFSWRPQAFSMPIRRNTPTWNDCVNLVSVGRGPIQGF